VKEALFIMQSTEASMGFFAQQIAVVTDLVTHLFLGTRVRLLASDYDDVT